MQFVIFDKLLDSNFETPDTAANIQNPGFYRLISYTISFLYVQIPSDEICEIIPRCTSSAKYISRLSNTFLIL